MNFYVNIKNMPKQLTSEEFKSIFTRVPRLCVDVLIKNEDGVLMTLRDIAPGKGMWHLPGGTVLFGETLANAAKRIAEDELGVDIEVVKILKVIEWLDPKTTIFGHSISIVILSKIKSGKIKLNEQASDFKFFKTPPKNTLHEHKEFLLNLD